MVSPLRKVPLAPLTTIGLGGEVEYLFECLNATDVQEAIRFAGKNDLPLFILGGGSNVIFADEGWPGVVLRPLLPGIRTEKVADGLLFRVGAGVVWDDFVKETIAHGYGDAVALSGIPGSVGAVPVQNVGAYGSEVSEIITEVRVMDRLDSTEQVISGPDCEFAYRYSRFRHRNKDRYIILEVVFLLKKNVTIKPAYKDLIERSGRNEIPCDPGSLEKFRELVISIRREKSMIFDWSDPDSRSAGSFFTNPFVDTETLEFIKGVHKERSSLLTAGIYNQENPVPHFRAENGWKIPAAWLIENSGFHKGFIHRGAGISSKHTLALVNRGGSARDLLELAHIVQSGVKKTFNVWLEREPVYAKLREGDKNMDIIDDDFLSRHGAQE